MASSRLEKALINGCIELFCRILYVVITNLSTGFSVVVVTNVVLSTTLNPLDALVESLEALHCPQNALTSEFMYLVRF